MIAQSVALCIIAVCAVLFGVGILRFILAWHRLGLQQQEADFRAAVLVASSRAYVAEARQAVSRG